MVKHPREVTLSATIVFVRHERQQSGRYSDEIVDSIDVAQGDVERTVRQVIESDLPSEINEIYGLKVRTRFISARPGSIIAFFAVVVEAIGVFASYSDFFESIALVRKHAAALLKRSIEDRHLHRPQYGANISVSVEFPRLPDPNDFYPGRWWRKRLGPEMEFFGAPWAAPPTTNRRDGLFWWLVISNVLMAAALTALLTAAVLKTYFS